MIYKWNKFVFVCKFVSSAQRIYLCTIVTYSWVLTSSKITNRYAAFIKWSKKFPNVVTNIEKYYLLINIKHFRGLMKTIEKGLSLNWTLEFSLFAKYQDKFRPYISFSNYVHLRICKAQTIWKIQSLNILFAIPQHYLRSTVTQSKKLVTTMFVVAADDTHSVDTMKCYCAFTKVNLFS